MEWLEHERCVFISMTSIFSSLASEIHYKQVLFSHNCSLTKRKLHLHFCWGGQDTQRTQHQHGHKLQPRFHVRLKQGQANKWLQLLVKLIETWFASPNSKSASEEEHLNIYHGRVGFCYKKKNKFLDWAVTVFHTYNTELEINRITLCIFISCTLQWLLQKINQFIPPSAQ